MTYLWSKLAQSIENVRQCLSFYQSFFTTTNFLKKNRMKLYVQTNESIKHFKTFEIFKDFFNNNKVTKFIEGIVNFVKILV